MLRVTFLLLLLLGTQALAQSAPGVEPPNSGEAKVETVIRYYLHAADYANRWGNFTAANRILQTLDGLRDRPEFSAYEQPIMALRLSNQVFSGLASTATRPPQGMRLDGKSLEQLYARICLVEAGRRAVRPHLVDENLAQLFQELRNYNQPKKTRVYQFVALSLAAERELQKNPELPLSQLQERHDAAWAALGGDPDLIDVDPLDGRLFWEAVGVWTDELHRRIRSAETTESKRLAKILAGDINDAVAISVPNESVLSVEYICSMLQFTLNKASQSIVLREFKTAQAYLDSAETAMTRVEQRVIPHGSGSTEAFAARVQTLLQAQGLTLSTAPLAFSAEQGDWAREKALLQQLRFRLLLAEARSSPTELKKRLDVAESLQVQAQLGQTWLGHDDVRWDRLNLLVGLRPPDWDSQAAPIVAELTAQCTSFNDRPGLIAASAYDGQLKAARGENGQAIASLKQSIALAEEYVTEAGNLNLRGQYRQAYELLAKLQLEAGQTAEAYDTLGRLQQMDALSASASTFRRVDALTNATTLRGQTEALQQEVAIAKASNVDPHPTEELLAKTKAEFHTALGQIRRTNPNYEAMLGIRPVNFSKQQGSIPADAAIVQYFPGEDSLYIFVATRDELKIHKVDVKPAALKEAITSFRAAIMKQQDVTEPTTRLHAMLIDPIEADVASKSVLGFIPTGNLNYLPFAALARKKGDRLEYLAERKQCAVLLKSADLDQLSHKPSASRKGVLALGNPDGSLPAAAEEARQIAGLFGNKAWLGAEARREKLATLPKGVAYLHLATHGTLDARDPSASYLLLAGKPDVAHLAVPQIYALKLDGVRLVTLSACKTGLGETEPGSELTTLADAFGVAGSNSVVASLWSVADESTKNLMVEFYQELKAGRPLAQALNGAQLAVLKNSKTRHPYYWAPFVLIGDWR